jgi:chromosome segregation ATPase
MASESIEAEIARYTAESDNWQQYAETLEQAAKRMATEAHRLTAERDAALTDQHRLRLELERMRAEAEGLRADLLAHPPEHAARIAELEADLAQVRYERDTALATSRERHAASVALWEEHQRKAAHDQMIIEGLRECLEKTEKRYIEVKARQVPRALVGLLGVIRREAAAAEKMIL